MSAAQPRADRERVLIVDDEENIRHAIAVNLAREGFAVLHAASGPDAIVQMRYEPHVVVLDIMLPDMNGLEVLREIRKSSTVPVLIVSARTEEFDRVIGLEIGADDYLTKPFAMRELVARVRALVRRSRMNHVHPAIGDASTASGPPDASRTLVAGDVRVDGASRQAFLREEELVLKPKEFDLLEYFVRHHGIVLSREALLREVWGYQHRVDTRTVDVHIRWLRQKLEDDAGEPTRLLTVRGHGYRFVAKPTDDE